MLMDLNIFILNGYGLYVWPAFIFTFLSYFILFSKTKKELKKQEKEFLKAFGHYPSTDVYVTEKRKRVKRILSESPIY